MTPETAQSLEQLDPFDHAFVDTLLHLRGVDEPPSYDEFSAALKELGRYYSALELAPPSTTALDDQWIAGESIDMAAAQLAYLFDRFGVLYRSQASPLQLLAFQRWWATGDEAFEYRFCPTCS
ncbi:MAG: hypothetical protein EOP08_16275, partial [Proteobacteria bacterium]